METKVVETNAINEKQILDTYLLFEYKCEKKEVVGNKIIFTFSRDDSVPYISELRKLEYQYGSYKVGSLIPGIVLPIISFILLTVFLVIFLVKRDEINVIPLFFAICGPALLFLLIGALFMILRLLAVSKIEKEKPLKDQEYRKKIEALKSNK